VRKISIIKKEHLNNNGKWSKRAETYDKSRFDYFRFMQKKLLSIIPVYTGFCFLDVGCGTGWAVAAMAKRLNGRGYFVGIDLAEGMILKAEQNFVGLENVAFYRASAELLPLADKTFNAAVCTNSFHHYIHPTKALNEIRRVLKPKGSVYILDVTADDVLTKAINCIVVKREKEHVRFYSTKEYRSMFRETRLRYVWSKVLGGYPLKVHQAVRD